MKSWGDLAALRDVIIDTAKWRYMQDHPERQRLPARFAGDLSLDLARIDEGSAIPVITLSSQRDAFSQRDTLVDFPLRAVAILSPDSEELKTDSADSSSYLKHARDSVIRAISAATTGENILEHISVLPLRHFKRIGHHLRPDESIWFGRQGNGHMARLDQHSRHRLLEAAQTIDSEKEVSVRGTVPEVDLGRKRFELLLPNGQKVVGRIQNDHLDVILEAFNGFSEQRKILISGTGRYDRYQRLTRFETIEDLVSLHALDVPARLSELRELRDGWLDGEGLAPDSAGLDWLSDIFEVMYPNEAPLPRIYPTPEGRVQAEWSFARHDVVLEIDLAAQNGEWSVFDMQSDADEEETLDLNEAVSWRKLGAKMASLSARRT